MVRTPTVREATNERKVPKSPIRPRFRDYAASKLRFEVKSGPNAITIKVE